MKSKSKHERRRKKKCEERHRKREIRIDLKIRSVSEFRIGSVYRKWLKNTIANSAFSNQISIHENLKMKFQF